MTRLVPPGFLTFREAVSKLEDAMFAGIPDREEVKKYREGGYSVADGASSRKAADELWNAVDQGRLGAVGIARQPFRINKLPASILQVPALRQTGDFTYLRPGNVAFEEVARAFGCRPATISLAFRDKELGKLCTMLRGTQRRKMRSSTARKVGRPSLGSSVRPSIIELIESKKWASPQPIKQLTSLLNRKLGLDVSADTVARELDKLHDEAGERRFARHRRIRKR